MIGGRYWAALGLAATVAGVAGLALAAPSPGPEVVVYKSPTCGCCKKWVEHVQAAGFRVTVHDTSSLAGVAVPGMPAGSPGMESDAPARYYILTFDKNGATSVYGAR